MGCSLAAVGPKSCSLSSEVELDSDVRQGVLSGSQLNLRLFFKRCPFFTPPSALRLWRKLSMWRPNQLSIDLKMDELLNQSIRKSIQDNPYLKPWVNLVDMRRDVWSRLPSWQMTDTHDAYLMAAQVRRTVISYHRKMTGPFGWTVDFSKINHQPGDPVSIVEWIKFHESVDLLTACEKFVFMMIAYGGFNVESLATLTGISHVTIDCLVSNASSLLHELVCKGR